MKINIKNLNTFKDKKNLKLSRRPMAGVLASFMVMSLFSTKLHEERAEIKRQNDEVHSSVVATFYEPIDISIQQVNDLNLIINNSNCSDSFISGVTSELDNDGIAYTLTESEQNIDVNGAVVISLDQQYISGPGMVVIAPYENNRNGNSDALALAVSTGFDELGFHVSDIQCGKIGYKELEDGTVVEKIPTESEDAINPNNETSFVTICFGTSNTNPDLVGKAIKLSLARYANYLSNENNNTDLIYRKEVGDSNELVAQLTGNNVSNISNDGILLDDTAVINSSVDSLDSFNKSIPVNLGGVESTIWYKR